MYHKLIVAAGAAMLMIAFDAAPAGAWAVRHAGFTRVTPYGVAHAGRTTVATPYGVRSYGGYGAAGYGGYGGYRYGYGYGGYRPVVPIAPVRPVYPVVPVGPVPPIYGAGVYRRY
jgi:hypothetical protein